MTEPRKSYAVRRTPEPFDRFDRWEVVELNAYPVLGRDRRVSNHFSKRKALKVLRRLEWNQAHPATVTSADLPLADLRTSG